MGKLKLIMKKKCYKCGMIRSTKDLVFLKDNNYMCFSCWNDNTRGKSEKIKKKRILD